MKLARYISIFILLFSINNSYAQSITGRAYELHLQKDYYNAKIVIDSAIHTDERFDSQTWQLRGFIYRSIADGDELYYREIALESFVRAKALDTTNIYTEQIDVYLRNTIVRYYNDAVILLTDEKEFERSEASYDNYKLQYRKLLDPNFDFNPTDINYYNAVGAEYLLKVEFVEPKKKNALREKALLYFDKVLQLDSMDYKANYNAGIVHYNTGADFIMIADPEITIDDLIKNQGKAEKAFLQSLPYLLRAELLDPESIEVKEALMGCYYGLNDNIKYLEYQTVVDKYMLPFYERRYLTHPRDKENILQLIRVYTYTLVDDEKANYYKTVYNNLN